MSGLVVADLDELSVLRSREAGSFVLRHARAGTLLSGSSRSPEGTLTWRLQALDEALSGLRLPTRSGEWVPLGLYNPYTFEVSVGPSWECEAFGDGSPLHFDSPMLEGVLEGGEMVLECGRRLERLSPSIDRASRPLLA